nr:MAG TPA: terminase large subunit [Caudoviricetes sp.]
MGKYDNTPGLARVLRQALQALRPPPDLTPSEWAEANVRIPVGNAVPGLIRFDNAPFQRLPMDMLVDPDCRRVTLMWAAQVGKTQTALCAQAYFIAMQPMSQMMMQPSRVDLEIWMSSKFDPLVEANPVLSQIIAKPRSREGKNNSKLKSYPGGFLMFSWAGSPKTMRGRSAPIIVVDEVDGYEPTPEGHPVSLIWQRAATFGDQRKLLEISTPTIRGQSYIEAAFLEGDQRRFWVPCPDCGEQQVLTWDRVTWDGRGDDEVEQRPETARYTCAHCASLWDDGMRKAAIRAGQWRAERPFRGHASFHLSEIYSMFRRLADIVQSYLDKKAADDLQSFVNISLAETWEETGEKADGKALASRAEVFAAPVPAGGLVLTAGVDMQQDRLECEVVAWGAGEESWSVDYRVLWGDPLQGDVWEDLEALLSSTWVHESGAHLPITAACVDTGGTGGSTQAAYDWLRGKTGRRVFGIKGISGWGRPIVAAPSRRQSGRKARKIDLFLVGVDEAKLAVMRRLQVSAPGPGYCHVPIERDESWYAQITAETLVTRYRKGFPIREWHKRADRNEALDCRVYALAALKIASPSLKRAAERIEADASRRAALERMAERATPAKPAPGGGTDTAATTATDSGRRQPPSAPGETPPAGPQEQPHGDMGAGSVDTARPRRSPFGMRRRRGGWAIN